MKTSNRVGGKRSKTAPSSQQETAPTPGASPAQIGHSVQSPAAPQFKALTRPAAIIFQQWDSQMRSNKKIIDIIDALSRFQPLIALHPDLEGEADAMRGIANGYNRLSYLTHQDGAASEKRKQCGDDDDVHDYATWCLREELLDPVIAWPAGKYADMLESFGDELLGISQLLKHNPYLKREVEAMELIAVSIMQLNESPALKWAATRNER